MDDDEENKLESQICWLISPSKSKLMFLETILSKFEENNFWKEPKIGNVFSQISTSGRDLGQIIVEKPFERKMNNPNYFFANQHKKNWLFATRKFLLTRIESQFGNTSKNIIIKDQTAIKCLDMISEILPKAKIIFLPEDGRKFVAENLPKVDIIDNSQKKKSIDEKDRPKLLQYYSTFWDVTMKIALKAFTNHKKELKLMVTDDGINNNSNEELEKILDFLKIKSNSIDTNVMSLNENFKLNYNELLTNEEKVICENIMHTTLANYGYLK